MISGREAYGAYTTFATETAILAITVAKERTFAPNINVIMNKVISWVMAATLVCGLISCTSCTSNIDNAPSVVAAEFIPKAPDYNDATMFARDKSVLTPVTEWINL